MTDKIYPTSISLWRVQSENERAPVYRGTVEVTPELMEYLAKQFDAGNEKAVVDVSLWRNESEHEKAPLLKGSVTEPKPREEREEKKSSGTKKTFTARTNRATRVL